MPATMSAPPRRTRSVAALTRDFVAAKRAAAAAWATDDNLKLQVLAAQRAKDYRRVAELQAARLDVRERAARLEDRTERLGAELRRVDFAAWDRN